MSRMALLLGVVDVGRRLVPAVGFFVVHRVIGLARGHRKIILYAVPGREAFYPKHGFRRMTTAMAIFADPRRAVADGYIEET